MSQEYKNSFDMPAVFKGFSTLTYLPLGTILPPLQLELRKVSNLLISIEKAVEKESEWSNWGPHF